MKKRDPWINLVTSYSYFQLVEMRLAECATSWRCGINRIDIWFGDSDSGSGQHPNFQIELRLGDTVAHRATFIGMTGNPDGRSPDGYNPNEASGPYCYADVLAMMNVLTQAA
jgi:hypothetical protein